MLTSKFVPNFETDKNKCRLLCTLQTTHFRLSGPVHVQGHETWGKRGSVLIGKRAESEPAAPLTAPPCRLLSCEVKDQKQVVCIRTICIQFVVFRVQRVINVRFVLDLFLFSGLV